MDISNNIAELESIARQTMSRVMDTEDRYNTAVENLNRSGMSQFEVARAKIDYEEITAERSKMRVNLPSEVSAKLNRIRADIQKKQENELALDPEKVDMRTVELLKLQTANARDIERLAENALADKNYTMLRIITADARRRAEELHGNPDHINDRIKFAAIAELEKNLPGSGKLDTFDAVAFLVERCIGNPHLCRETKLLEEFFDKLKG